MNTTKTIIKKEITIAAPAAKVWVHITDPTKIAGWFAPNDFEPTVGHAFFVQGGECGKIACVVKEVVPPEKLSYSFQSKTTKVETLVTITLAEEDGRTRLTLIHSGWDALPPEEQSVAGGFDSGWGHFLGILQQQMKA